MSHTSSLRAPGVAVLTVLAVLASVLALASTDSASAATTAVPAAADTYVRSDAKRASFGSDTRWSVDGRRNARRNAYLKFTVPAPPSGSRYSGAVLRAFSDGSASAGAGPAVYTTANSWSESDLTWATQPPRGSWLASKGGYGATTWVEWDVSAAVPESGGTVSFRVETTERTWLGFESSENANGRHPQLVLTSAPLDSSTTPLPSPTDTASPTQTASPTAAPTGTATPTAPAPEPGTAAERLGWGAPVAGDEFGYTGAPDPSKWNVYDSAGHAGNGVRSPAAWNVDGNVVRVTGDSQGTTGGMSANFDRRTYGRWEVRMRTNARDPEYHPVLILWPDSENWPCDGEIDFAEGTSDVTKMHFYHHYSCSNSQTSATRTVDTTQWHNYAVEWTPSAIVGYLDGVEWFRDTDPSHQPPGPMHQTIQLDWFPDGTTTSTSWMEVDWVRVYDVGTTTTSPTATPTPTPTAPTTTAPPPATGDIKLAVLGDVNHDGNSSTTSREGKIASSISAWGPTAVGVLGDFQYQYGDCTSLVNEFDRTGWGALMPKVIAAAGPTHDYTSTVSSAADYSRHMEGTCPGQTTGPSLSAQAWDRTIQPYEPHVVDLGAWTVVSMPSAQWRSGYNTAYGSQWSGSSLTAWLDSAVAAADARGDHVAVIEHEPYWSSGTDGHSETEGDAQRPWIDVLDKYDVRLVLAGHQHNYERFHPQNADSSRNDATGTQQFQVSTGGIGLRAFTTTAANSAVKNDDTFGWLQLVLRADGSYTWTFVPTEGTFTDSGARPAP